MPTDPELIDIESIIAGHIVALEERQTAIAKIPGLTNEQKSALISAIATVINLLYDIEEQKMTEHGVSFCENCHL